MDANKAGPRRPKKPRLTALNRLDIEACLNDGKLQKSPFVCNACPDRNKCVLTKRFYRGAAAQENYETILSESRRGVNLTEEEIGKFDELMYGLVKKGQSIHAIMVNNPTLFMAASLLEAKTSDCVTAAFATILVRLAELYGGDNGMIFGTYEELFNTILTDLGSEKFGADIAEKVFGIRKVNPNDVVLKPSLLGLEVKVKEWVSKDESGK